MDIFLAKLDPSDRAAGKSSPPWVGSGDTRQWITDCVSAALSGCFTWRYAVKDPQRPLRFNRSTLHLERILYAVDRIMHFPLPLIFDAYAISRGPKLAGIRVPDNIEENTFKLNAKLMEEEDHVCILFPGSYRSCAVTFVCLLRLHLCSSDSTAGLFFRFLHMCVQSFELLPSLTPLSSTQLPFCLLLRLEHARVDIRVDQEPLQCRDGQECDPNELVHVGFQQGYLTLR